MLSSVAFSLAHHFTLGVGWGKPRNPSEEPVFRSAFELGTYRANLLVSVWYRNVYWLWNNEIVPHSPSVTLADIPQKRNPYFNINLWRVFTWYRSTRFRITPCFSWKGVNLSVGTCLNECFVSNVLLSCFDVLLTVHLSIFSVVINQLDAQFFFTISLFNASTCFEDHVLIIRWSKLYYTASGIITLKQASGLKLLKYNSINVSK